LFILFIYKTEICGKRRNKIVKKMKTEKQKYIINKSTRFNKLKKIVIAALLQCNYYPYIFPSQYD